MVQKQTYRGSTLASSTVVSSRMAWDNIFMAEVVRSCPEMCRWAAGSLAVKSGLLVAGGFCWWACLV